MVHSTYTRNSKFASKKFQVETPNKLLTPTRCSSHDLEAGIQASSAQVVAAIQYRLNKNTQNQPQRLLTDGRIVDVTEERVVDVTEEVDAQGALGNDSSSREEIDVPAEKTSYNPFDNMVDAVKEKASYNPFDEIAGDSGKEISASRRETVVIEERDVPRKGGLDYVPNWTSDIDSLTPSKPTYTGSIKNVFQTLTQRKVLMVAGSALLLVAGGAAAYCLYPVATAAFAATALEVGNTAATSTLESFILPGFANTMFLGNLIMKMAIIPAANLTIPVLLPLISTAICTTLTTLALIYVANRVWVATTGVVGSAGSKFCTVAGNELDKTCVGTAVKEIIADGYSLVTAPVRMLGLLPEKTTEKDVQRSLQITDSTEASEVETTHSIGDEKVEENMREQTARATLEEKVRRNWVTFYKCAFLAAGVSTGTYFIHRKYT